MAPLFGRAADAGPFGNTPWTVDGTSEIHELTVTDRARNE